MGGKQGEWVGVEIECYMPYRGLIKGGHSHWETAQRKLSMLLKEADIPNVQVKGDSSVSSPDDGKYFEVEIALLFERTDKKPLRRLCRLLQKLNATANRTCGLHVHLDCRDLATETTVTYSSSGYAYQGAPAIVRERGEKINNVLPLMLKMVSKSRRNNSYCRPVMSDQRSAINLGAFERHKTIEVRLHQGTVQYSKIANWVELLFRASRAKQDMKVENVTQLKKYLKRSPKVLTTYVQKRIKQVNAIKGKKVA